MSDDVIDRLERLKEEHRDARNELSYESYTCAQAAQTIQNLRTQVAELERQRHTATVPVAVLWLAVGTIANSAALIVIEVCKWI